MPNIIEMPKLSDTMTDGVLVKWLKAEGDAVKSGDMLAEVETDKATMELECFFDGTLLRIFAAPGSRVAIGAPLCAIGKPGEDVEAPKAPAPQGAGSKGQGAGTKEQGAGGKEQVAAPSIPQSAVRTPQSSPPPSPLPPPAPDSSEGRIRISPLARKLAAEKGVDPVRIQGSGPAGRIVRADVLATASGSQSAVRNPQSAVQGTGASILAKGPIQPEAVVPVSNMRGIIARRLVESKSSIPHFYLEVEVDAAPLLSLRTQLVTALEKEGVKLSVNDFVLKASAEALRRVPAVNCSWETDASGQPVIRRHGAAHVSFAVAIEDGLITPVIRDAHLKTLFAISAETKTLARRAKDKKLAPNEFTGGTFCVSNLGMMGIDRFSAIINPPNAAILAVGATVRKPVVAEDGSIVAGQRMTLTLSCDHRVVDGAVGATFLAALRDLLEKPALLLL